MSAEDRSRLWSMLRWYGGVVVQTPDDQTFTHCITCSLSSPGCNNNLLQILPHFVKDCIVKGELLPADDYHPSHYDLDNNNLTPRKSASLKRSSIKRKLDFEEESSSEEFFDCSSEVSSNSEQFHDCETARTLTSPRRKKIKLM